MVDFSNGFDQAKIETTFRVEDAKSNAPALTSKTNGKRTVSFGLSHDGAFLACGNGTRDGIVYVYDLNAKKSGDDGLSDDAAQPSSPLLAAKLLPHERHSGTMLDVIRSCAIAKDCRHVLGTTDANDGTNRAWIVFRYEIIPEQPKEYEPKSEGGKRKKKPSLTSSTTRKTKTQFDEIKKRCCSCCSSPRRKLRTNTNTERDRERERISILQNAVHLTRKQRHLI